ncbi:hypothetical protein BV25DRAFT_1906963 [Artomyces pyxidatus]|uniref:Uncharacterized protein n=1 Tax=Artomyces pyxidatus TaxID=48021 RepID=A0ACB8T442_9AGAM|nr:hypothetical protein BV25DRAFT_1906963 [Artomyces pyxidatus]
MSDPSFGTTYPYAPHVFPMTIPPSSRSASFPASSRGHLPHLPQQTPRSVHWGPYGPGPGDDNFSVPSTESERLTPPGFTGYKFPPVPSWNPMYTGTSSQTVRPPTNHHLTPVFTQSPMRSPSPETEVTQYAPGGLFGPRSPSQSMEDGQSRRSSRTETHESMSENDFVRGFTCIPAPPLQPLPPQVPRPRDFVPSVPSEASRRSPSPPPLVNSPPRLRVTPVWDPEIHNSPLIRPPSAALMESLRVRTPPIELVLPSLATPPRPITIENTAPLAHTAKRRFEPRHASSLSTSSTIDEPSTMSSPARSIFTDSSYIAPSAPQHVEEDASFFTPLPARRSQTILMLESFFDTLKRDFQFPNKVELSYRSYGFILDWARVHPSSVISSPADGAEHRKFSLTDASVHAYMQDLRKLLGDLESLRPDNAAGREELSVRIEEELERTEKWIDTVCVTAGSLNLADQAISAKDVFSGNGRL